MVSGVLDVTVYPVNRERDSFVRHAVKTVGMSTLADRINAILRKNGWSQRELSKRSGLNDTGINTLLAQLKTDPLAATLTTIRKIAEGAGVSFDWLLTGRDELAEEALKAPVLSAHPRYAELLPVAQELQRAPAWVWARVGETRAIIEGDDLTAGALADLAAFIMRHHRPTSR